MVSILTDLWVANVTIKPKSPVGVASFHGVLEFLARLYRVSRYRSSRAGHRVWTPGPDRVVALAREHGQHRMREPAIQAQRAVTWARDHIFERSAVHDCRAILDTALARGMGESFLCNFVLQNAQKHDPLTWGTTTSVSLRRPPLKKLGMLALVPLSVILVPAYACFLLGAVLLAWGFTQTRRELT